jgi:RimJ/RimL family protein N-acetyltransferase
LKIYAADAQWEQTAAMLLQPLHPRLRQRSLYTLKLPTKEAKARELPQGFRVQPIDHNLLYQQTLTYHSQVLEEIESCWTSVEQFGREGFGFWVITERNEVVCWCTAEYVSPGKCGIGIETIEAYQERGLATVTAHAFLQHALSLGWQIYWDTWQGNIPSVRIAENFGFQKQVDYPVSLLILD